MQAPEPQLFAATQGILTIDDMTSLIRFRQLCDLKISIEMNSPAIFEITRRGVYPPYCLIKVVSKMAGELVFMGI